MKHYEGFDIPNSDDICFWNKLKAEKGLPPIDSISIIGSRTILELNLNMEDVNTAFKPEADQMIYNQAVRQIDEYYATH